MSETCGYGFDYSRRIVDQFSHSLSKDIVDIHDGGLSSATGIDLPIFSAWLARETGDVTKVLEAALELKKDPDFVAAREMLRDIRNAHDADDIAAANKAVGKIKTEIEKASNDVRGKYCIETPQGLSITRLVQVYNTVAAIKSLPQLPEYDFKIPVPEFIRDLMTPSGFNSIYRNLTDDLASVWALGEVRDVLGASVVEDKKAYAYNPKSESPKYRDSHSEFKSPM